MTGPSLDAPDDDPFLWLEEVEGERALAWVTRQNARTHAAWGGPGFEADRDAVKAGLDRPGRLPGITRRGGHLYDFWQDAAHPSGIWRRTTLADFAAGRDAWEVLFDLDAHRAATGGDWAWQGAATLLGTHGRALLHLSRGGSDAATIREYDIAARAFVADGFHTPEARGHAEWVDRDTLLLSSTLGGLTTHAGLARGVRLWRRGEAPEAAPIIFETDHAHMMAWAGLDRDVPGRLSFHERTRFFDVRHHLGDSSGAKTRLDAPEDAELAWDAHWLALRPRRPWLGHAADTLLGIGLDTFLAGGRDFAVLARTAPRRSLRGFFFRQGRLLVSELDELRPRYTILAPGEWRAAVLPGMPDHGVAGITALDHEPEESDGTLLLTTEDPLTPPRLSLTGMDCATPALLRASAPMFRADGLAVTRHEAISADGTRIPYVQTGPAGAPRGDAPVHLYGYGGFRISVMPRYRGSVGKLWLERGGTTVTAHLRGGGEFGTAWHQGAIRENKRLSHDDFAAVAADLAARGVTRPSRIAAEGGSNGGLLIANMLTRYPERFGALFCTIPLIDMRRFHKLLIGASWIAEYGNPDDPADWQFMREFSAYHRAEAGRAYPPILIATTRRDDRVHPAHARKMVARLQALGHAAWLHEPPAGGHGHGKDNAEVAGFVALGTGFLRRAIGWE